MTKPKRKSTAKQRAALKRGSLIRSTRGCIGLVRNLLLQIPINAEGRSSLIFAESQLVRFHNKQFGHKLCWICRTQIDPVATMCEKCLSAGEELLR